MGSELSLGGGGGVPDYVDKIFEELKVTSESPAFKIPP